LAGAGWVAFGVGASMADADVALAYVENGQAVLEDRYSNGYMLPILDDSNSITLVDGTETGGVTRVTFRRPLAAADAQDRQISATGVTPVIFAWGDSDTLSYHGPNRVAGVSINFMANTDAVLDDPQTPAFDYIKVFSIHGVLLFLSWGIFVPVAIFAVRYRKHYAYWLALHRYLMTMVVAITSLAAGLGVIAAPGDIGKPHHWLGFVVTGFAILQAIAGSLVRYWHTSFVPPLQYVLLRTLHRWCGRVALVASFVTCAFGAQLLEDGLQWAVLVWGCVLVCGFIVAEIIRVKDVAAAPDTVPKRKVLATLTQGEFERQVSRGAKWVMLNSVVYDVGSFIPVHPGGTYLLTRVIGQDVGSYFFGRTQVDSQGELHKHSASAHKLLSRFVRGVLVPGGGGGAGSSTTERSAASREAGGFRVTKGGLMRSPSASVIVDGVSPQSEARYVLRSPANLMEAADLPERVKKILLSDEDLERDDATPDIWTLVAQEQLTHSKRPSFALTLAPPPGASVIPFSPLAFGRHMTVHHSRDGSQISTPYTLTRFGTRGNKLEEQWPGSITLVVRQYPSGFASNKLCTMMLGESVLMSGPQSLGIQLNRDSVHHVLAFASGSGVTPFIDLVEYIVECEEGAHPTEFFEGAAAEEKPAGGISLPGTTSAGPTRLPPLQTTTLEPPNPAEQQLSLSLLACFGMGDDMVLHAWLYDMCKRSKGRFTYMANLKHGADEWVAKDPAHRSAGHVGEDQVREFVENHVPEGRPTEVWVCGGPDFKRDIAHVHLPACGVPQSQIHSM